MRVAAAGGDGAGGGASGSGGQRWQRHQLHPNLESFIKRDWASERTSSGGPMERDNLIQCLPACGPRGASFLRLESQEKGRRNE